MNSEQTLRKALADPACHYSLKGAIRHFIYQDPVDAACDTQWLSEVFRLRLAEVTASSPVTRPALDKAAAYPVRA